MSCLSQRDSKRRAEQRRRGVRQVRVGGGGEGGEGGGGEVTCLCMCVSMCVRAIMYVRIFASAYMYDLSRHVLASS